MKRRLQTPCQPAGLNKSLFKQALKENSVISEPFQMQQRTSIALQNARYAKKEKLRWTLKKWKRC